MIWAPGGEKRPYKCPVSFPSEKSTRFEKGCYIRKLSNTIRANILEEKELFLLADNVPFDDRANMKAEILDMRSSLISEYLYAINSDLYKDCLNRPLDDVANDLKIIGGPSE